MKGLKPPGECGFTLIEMMLASVAAAIILVAVYGLFHRAIKMRDSAMQRVRDSRLRARAEAIIGSDLRNAFVSGGILASSLEGDSDGAGGAGSGSGGQGSGSGGPASGSGGYLKIMTTAGKDTTDETYGDVQQVEYYIEKDGSDAGPNDSGTLVRLVTRDLLDTTPSVTHEERLLTGVSSFQVSFYDGTEWQQSWVLGGTNASPSSGSSSAATSGSTEALPDAVRVDIQQAPATDVAQPPPPLEITQPWTAIPFLSGTNFTTGESS